MDKPIWRTLGDHEILVRGEEVLAHLYVMRFDGVGAIRELYGGANGTEWLTRVAARESWERFVPHFPPNVRSKPK